MSMTDVIDHLAGLAPGSPVALIRDRKPITRDQAQASHRALFEPADPGDVPLRDRFAVATFVAGLHGQDDIAAFYRQGLERSGANPPLVAALMAEIGAARTHGPYGAYPPGPLSVEDAAGPVHAVAEAHAAILGARLTAALAHVHMLVYHPRDARPHCLQTLLDAGWSNAGIVTLSQLVAFLAFQIRTVVGLRTLAATIA